MENMYAIIVKSPDTAENVGLAKISPKELLSGAAMSTNRIVNPMADTYIAGCDLSKNANPNIDKCAEKYIQTIIKSQLSTND